MFIKKYFTNHNQLKDKILKEISNAPSQTNLDDKTISKSDFYIESSRKYFNYIFPFLQKEIFSNFVKELEFQIKNVWFQQYEQDSQHTWHVHPFTNWFGIYYLELDQRVGTIIMNPITGDTDPTNVVEGDIFLCPAIYPHCSPINSSGKRKTVIAFNIDCRYKNN
jgi:hypothetical protein